MLVAPTVFPYWGLATAFNTPVLLSTGTAFGVTVLQWGTVAVAFGWLTRRVAPLRPVVFAAVATILTIALAVRGVIWAGGLTVTFDVF
jgi:hypothetical protein